MEYKKSFYVFNHDPEIDSENLIITVEYDSELKRIFIEARNELPCTFNNLIDVKQNVEFKTYKEIIKHYEIEEKKYLEA